MILYNPDIQYYQNVLPKGNFIQEALIKFTKNEIQSMFYIK